eukprot:535996_1
MSAEFNLKKALKNLDQAEPRIKDTVFGFTRQHSNTSNVSIPSMISYICLSYYFIYEKLVKITHFMNEKQKQSMIHAQSQKDPYVLNRPNNVNSASLAHGFYVIDFTIDTNHIIQWLFEIDTDCAVIGLFSIKPESKFYCYKTSNGNISTGIRNRSWSLSDFKHCRRGDTVRMVFDTQYKTLMYYKNQSNEHFGAISIPLARQCDGKRTTNDTQYIGNENDDTNEEQRNERDESPEIEILSDEDVIKRYNQKLSLWVEVQSGGSVKLVAFGVLQK